MNSASYIIIHIKTFARGLKFQNGEDAAKMVAELVRERSAAKSFGANAGAMPPTCSKSVRLEIPRFFPIHIRVGSLGLHLD